MLLSQIIAVIVTACVTMFGGAEVIGQNFPVKPVRIVTGGIGTNSESVSRIVAHGMSDVLGQQVIVDSRGGMISMEAVIKAAPDGYTLLLQGSGVWLLPLMRDNVPWEPLKDYASVAIISNAPGVLIVHPSLPVKSVKDLIALAKAKPGALNYGSGNSGSTSHLGPELLKAMAGINIVRVNYKGSGAALNALMAGEIQLSIASAGTVTAQIKSGRVRALAVTDGRRSALAPGLPTVGESGLPGYEANSIAALFAPGKTPDAVIRRLNQAAVQILGRSDIKEKLYSLGVESVGSSPEEMGTLLKAEVSRWSKVIQDAGIRGE